MGFTPFERRRRAAARFALYTSLVLVAALLALLLAYLDRPLRLHGEQAWRDVDYASLPEVELLRDYVRIDTTKATGNEQTAARFLAERLRRPGVEVHVEAVGKRRANLWAVLEGDDPHALVLMSHLDVEPIHEPERWDYPPFGAVIDGPWLYGRGTFDMKSVTTAQLSAFLDVAARGVRPRRSLIFLATSSEESGSAVGLRWLLREHPELPARFWGVLTEGGWLEGRSTDNLKYWGVEFAQKRFGDIEACSSSRERLEALRDDLHAAGFKLSGLRMTRAVAEFLEAYAPSRDRGDLRELLEHPERFLHDPAAFATLPPYIQSLFRDEIVPFPIEKAPGGGYRMLLKLHMLPGSDPDRVRAELLPAWMTQGVALAVREPDPPEAVSPLDHPLFQAAVSVLREADPETTVGPLFLAWTATDSRYLRARGIPSYGFSPFIYLTTDTLHVSAANERISLPGYVEGVELYRRLVHRVVAGEH